MKNVKLQKYIEQVTNEMSFTEARTGVRREILSHLEEKIEVAQSYGLSHDAATDDSISRMGNATELGRSLNQIHQPKLDFTMLGIISLLCAIGLFSLADTNWLKLQSLWMILGIATASAIYRMPSKILFKFIASLYPLATVGIIAAQFSQTFYDNQPHLSILGLSIKIIDFAGCLFSISFPAAMYFVKPKYKSATTTLLFLGPLSYFGLSGYLWPSLLFFTSGQIYFSSQKYSGKLFFTNAILGIIIISLRMLEAFTPAENIAKKMTADGHTDFILHSLTEKSAFLSILCTVLLVSLIIYGIRSSSHIKNETLRSIGLVGIAILGIQIFVGIFANYGITPVIQSGVNIPFISYGGSMLLGNFIAVGMLLATLKRQSILEID